MTWTDSWSTVVRKGRQAKFWYCNVAECKAFNKGRCYWNAQDQNQCGQCQAYKGTAAAEQHHARGQKLSELREQVATRAATPAAKALTKAQSRRQRAKSLKEGAKAAANADATEDVKPPDAPAAVEQTSGPGATSAEDPQSTKTPTPKQIEEMEETLLSPQPLDPDWTPEAVVDGRPRAKATELVEDFQGELDDCEAFLELGDRAAKMGINLEVTKARITELKKLIEKAGKKVPAVASAAELALHQEKYLERHAEKQVRSRKAAGVARQTFVQLQMAQQSQIDYWQQKLQRTADLQMARQDEWEDRAQDLDDRHQQVMQEFERRISAARKQGDGAVQEPAVLPAQQQVPVAQQLNQQQLKVQTLRERQRPAFFEQTAMDLDHSKLPEITEEDLNTTAGASACGNLYSLLTQWLHAGAAVPFTFTQLADEAWVGAEAKTLVLRLLGEQQALWFQNTPAEDDDLIPRQAVIALLTVLGSAKTKFDAREEIRTNATATYTRLAEQHQQRLW